MLRTRYSEHKHWRNAANWVNGCKPSSDATLFFCQIRRAYPAPEQITALHLQTQFC